MKKIIIGFVFMLSLAGLVNAATETFMYCDLYPNATCTSGLYTNATIEVPESAKIAKNFSINYSGFTNVDGPSRWFEWWLYEGGTCNDPIVDSCNGTVLNGSEFSWGHSISGTYTISKSEGNYTYWFCMGARVCGYIWYDVCVSSDVAVTFGPDCDPNLLNPAEYKKCIEQQSTSTSLYSQDSKRSNLKSKENTNKGKAKFVDKSNRK